MEWVQLTKQSIFESDCLLAIKALIDQLPFEINARSASDRERLIETVRDRIIKDVSKSYQPQNSLWITTMANVLADLCNQKWELKLENNHIFGRRPKDMGTREELRERLVSRRNQQLREKSVQQFISDMEKWRIFNNQKVSILSLITDGRELFKRISTSEKQTIHPYVQFVKPDQICEHTGLKLQDIWRYFRHTWTSPYESIPGRSLLMLIRDSSVSFHPIIGISALSSAAIRLSARDKFIGWDTDQIISECRTNPTNEIAEWVLTVLNKSFKGIYLVDFIRDGVITANPTEQITTQTINNLRQIALKQKESHYRLMDGPEYKAEKKPNINSDEDWELQALTPLFRSKRAGELANILETWLIIYNAFIGKSGEERLSNLLSTDIGRNAFSRIIRISRSMTVGTEIADLTICGAVAPYNHIAGGKLVAMLAASPVAVSGYSERYSASSSIIASSMAGRKISRSANLVFVGTTSLYGKRPNQYDRVSYPANLTNGLVNQQIKYHFIPDNQADDGISKNTKGVGTFHFGPNTLRAMESFTIAMRGGWKVNNVFGEGASPKLRALRDGLDALGLNSDELLIHGIGKCIYGANLAINTSRYLLGIDQNPDYIFSLSDPDESTAKISEWWYHRWVKPRISREDIQKKISSETLVYPIKHNAKVKLPESDNFELDLQ